MIGITIVPGGLFFEDHLSCRYVQASWIYVCGGSTGFKSEVWKTSGKAGGVRMGVGVGVRVVVAVRVRVGVIVGLGDVVGVVVSVGTGIVAGTQAARIATSRLMIPRRRAGKCQKEDNGRILPARRVRMF
jgi:hypothetical protein